MIKLKTKIPGLKSTRILAGLKKKNGGWGDPHPLVFSGKGKGAYCEDIDGNTFLDFACQVASNPLGYNHPELLKVVSDYNKRFPLKYAGQDFTVEEHLDMIESILGISPGMNQVFLSNSGAEAVENAIKIAMHDRDKKKFTVSFQGAFHGRTLGALSLHHSKPVHREGYMLEPNKELSFSDEAGDELQGIVNEHGADAVAFVILEHLQGEGGYRIPSDKMVRDVYSICRKNGIPYVADEVQAGMGRTGKWWAFEHYGIKPDVFSSAKALQVGATVSTSKLFPGKVGAISSTWGGGHALDLAVGMKTIEMIKKKKLLEGNRKNGDYIKRRLNELGLQGVRGRGLSIAFDLASGDLRNKFVLDCARHGLLVLGCGMNSVRVIPPYVIKKDEIDEGISVISKVSRTLR